MQKTLTHEGPLIAIMMNENIAKCLSDPHRLKILDFLYHKSLSTRELFELLKKAKFDIAMTTLRHHISMLKKNDLISIKRTKQVKGTLEKYYKSNVKILAYENYPFLTFAKDNKELVRSLYPKFYKMLKKLLLNEKELVSIIFSDIYSRCKICKSYHYAEYLFLMFVNMVLAKIVRKLLKSILPATH
ncbi:ArsR/SmtB family transcription factor [Candidatus Nitrosocosmicus agrestis]|jgi:DNA-binding transcriptional ArsR family regulator|uniref:ArsR/SmtB family transcription factor n=1 Tax=Candidatus Nitrosocosmicus agrestis TaxID=2563600 RepID=UPI00122DD5D4|nr:helix-turn-helix domain-containing protein [Candidatus Nitrosocosmicus sp. SS]KAA2282420.1 helix-turn-helix transcriptional regulator [Candidatus Nitrosocosmicus sp. SS]KAF0867986.1 helix-turn-helix transcriptional regulator [Candidatus Nitrosocosmicus sp. SS]